MEFADVLRRRRMVRRFDPDRPVQPAALEAVLYAAQRAPSAGFSQGWDFVVLVEDDDRARFWSASGDPATASGAAPDRWLAGVSAAPVLVLCLSDPDTYLDRYAEPDKGWADRDPARWPVPYWDVDTGMAAMLMLLAAVEEGLGGWFFGITHGERELLDRFGVPPDLRPIGILGFGYRAADEEPSGSWMKRRRRPLAEQVHRNGW